MIECLLHPPMIFMLTVLLIGFVIELQYSLRKRDMKLVKMDFGFLLYGLVGAFMMGAMMVPYFC